MAWRFLAPLITIVLGVAACSDSSSEESSGGTADPGPTTTAEAAAATDGGTATTSTIAAAELVFDNELSPAEQNQLDEAITSYLDGRATDDAEILIGLMGRSGDATYVPWLVDLLRLGLPSRLTEDLTGALEALTSVEPVGINFEDFGRYGSVVQNNEIDPGNGYRAWKFELYRRLDAGFVPLLDSIEDDVELGRIQWGGVPRGGIPELNDPLRIPLEDAIWMEADEIVLGAFIDGEAVAYPLRILGHHELVNDQLNGVPISFVYCTLCRTGVLYDRRVEVDGTEQLLDFQTSGLLSNSNKIMVDRQTDTLWQQATGVGIGGTLAGVELRQLPSVTTTWDEWVTDFPESAVLDIPGPIFFDDPERPPIAFSYEPGDAYADYYADPDVWFPVLDTPEVFAAKDEVIGIEIDGSALAVQVMAIRGGSARWFSVGDRAIVIVPTSAGGRVYEVPPSSVLPGQSGDEVAVIETDDPSRVRLDDGTELDQRAADQSFWFSWYANHLDTETWPTGER